MKNILFIITFILYCMVVSSCTNTNLKLDNQFTYHDLKIRLIPEEHKLLAVDTLQILYTEKTDDVYFFLNKNLVVDRINLGNQVLPFTKLSGQDFSKFVKINFCNNKLPLNIDIYRVVLPKSLHPICMKIQYEGTLEKSHTSSQAKDSDFSQSFIDKDNILLSGNHYWYPTLPDFSSSYKISALTPSSSILYTAGELLYKEERNDSLVTIWQQNTPMKYIDLKTAVN